MTAYIFDTETTDSDPNTAQIIEAAWIRYPDGTMWEERFKPSAPIKLGALAVHHILPEELEDCRPHTEFALPQNTEYIIGHNIDYDWKVASSPAHVKRICTLAMSRAIFPELDSHTQSAMLYHLVGGRAARDMLRNAHSALADVQNCLELFNMLKAASGRTFLSVEAIWQFSETCRIPTKMTFGKHKGEPISAVPRSYASWYANQPDPDPYLIEAFKRARKLA